MNISLGVNQTSPFEKNAWVIHIHNDGDPSEATNHHSISLLPTLGKIVKKCLGLEARLFVENYNLITPTQF